MGRSRHEAREPLRRTRRVADTRIRAALGGHVAEGATLVHDRERAHNVLVRENGLADESYKADARDPEYLEAMELANNLRSWLKRCLWRFTGMDPENLQSYLNLYVYFFRVKRQSQARRREVAQDRKGGPPSAHGRSEVPQVRGVPLSPIWVTVRKTNTTVTNL